MATTTRPRINHSLELSRLYPSCYPCFKGARRCSSTDNQGARPCDRCVKDGLPPEECVAHQDDPRWVAGKSGATKRRDGGKGGRDNAYDGGVRAATTEGLRRSARSTRFTFNHADAESAEEEDDQTPVVEQSATDGAAEANAGNETVVVPSEETAAEEDMPPPTARNALPLSEFSLANRGCRVKVKPQRPDQDDY
ncbi:hypothetical protein CB0940_05966 [Cercospora beticola]|uniref:Zn(2)-C6 fungal-type domain-containing protein n=1 Tax=Cercospora beticola TaxID=122368 RepID=A0A2G5HXJ9_CERBT|nr:hypothetical protein CB0940_05966 [Cercospora beticola]PIA97231.1 hypothetical protein CB0940_05966 [Cercospora beticola]WPA98567.1 hypothetical protein RHO25_003179 [Cercospora beticola]CAK1359828.1 unnamed protein product [Cercospora beticola]